MNIELEIERAKRDADEYGKLCLDSAYKAYKSLEEDGHSGLSFSITRSILRKLLYEIPLSPITEEDFEGVEPHSYHKENGIVSRQCPRRYSLFQDRYPDGHIEYHDIDQTTFIDELGNSWGSGWASNVINKLHPIMLPYVPNEKPYRVYGYSFMHNPDTCEVWIERGSYTFTYLDYYIEPDGTRHELDMMFEDEEVTDSEKKEKIKRNAIPVIEQSIEEHRKWLEEME